MTDKILGFQNEYRFLSNFFSAPIIYEGMFWKTTENAYQAMKFEDIAIRKTIQESTAGGSKKYAGKASSLVRKDWHEISIKVMTDITELKFQIPALRSLLMDTGDAYIEETNSHRDTFWGVCNGIGENHLGKIIMTERDRILNNELCK